MSSTPLIAIVDDEESICRALGRLIRSAHLDAETFPSGVEFLETIPDHKPDCVVLDLQMPRADGFRVQAWLAEAGLRIPVIVITGRDTPETRARALENGAFAYFRKPVDGEALLDAIAAAIARKKGQKLH
ncbi:MAG TPA: response regulator [Thermoanaerobaculia bacterium]